MSAVPTVAIVGEDTAHAVLLGALLRACFEQTARESGREYLVENIRHDPAFIGDIDLSRALDGLRYTSSILGTSEPTQSPTIAGRPVRLRGHFEGHPARLNAQKWRRFLFGVLAQSPSVTLIAADTDGDLASLAGLRQAVEHYQTLAPERVIVVAAPHQDAEAWFVAGFEPDEAREHDALDALRRALGFDPTIRSERLTAQPNNAPTDAKRVIRRLLFHEDRSVPLSIDEILVWRPRLLGDLDRLHQRGGASGLTTFLDELHASVIPRLIPGVG